MPTRKKAVRKKPGSRRELLAAAKKQASQVKDVRKEVLAKVQELALDDLLEELQSHNWDDTQILDALIDEAHYGGGNLAKLMRKRLVEELVEVLTNEKLEAGDPDEMEAGDIVMALVGEHHLSKDEILHEIINNDDILPGVRNVLANLLRNQV